MNTTLIHLPVNNYNYFCGRCVFFIWSKVLAPVNKIETSFKLLTISPNCIRHVQVLHWSNTIDPNYIVSIINFLLLLLGKNVRVSYCRIFNCYVKYLHYMLSSLFCKVILTLNEVFARYNRNGLYFCCIIISKFRSLPNVDVDYSFV